MIRLTRLIGLLGAAALALSCAGDVSTHVAVGESGAAVRAAFDRDAERARMLLILSPTCGHCLLGASQVARAVEDLGDSLRLYVVWVPMLGATEAFVPEATRMLDDPRALHFWDAEGFFVSAFERVLGLQRPAWDLYLLYPPGERWQAELPPPPTRWMQQHGGADDGRLDEARLAEALATLMEPAL